MIHKPIVFVEDCASDVTDFLADLLKHRTATPDQDEQRRIQQGQALVDRLTVVLLNTGADAPSYIAKLLKAHRTLHLAGVVNVRNDLLGDMADRYLTLPKEVMVDSLTLAREVAKLLTARGHYVLDIDLDGVSFLDKFNPTPYVEHIDMVARLSRQPLMATLVSKHNQYPISWNRVPESCGIHCMAKLVPGAPKVQVPMTTYDRFVNHARRECGLRVMYRRDNREVIQFASIKTMTELADCFDFALWPSCEAASTEIPEHAFYLGGKGVRTTKGGRRPISGYIPRSWEHLIRNLWESEVPDGHGRTEHRVLKDEAIKVGYGIRVDAHVQSLRDTMRNLRGQSPKQILRHEAGDLFLDPQVSVALAEWDPRLPFTSGNEANPPKIEMYSHSNAFLL